MNNEKNDKTQNQKGGEVTDNEKTDKMAPCVVRIIDDDTIEICGRKYIAIKGSNLQM